MSTKVSLIFYANPDHYSIDDDARRWLMSSGYGKLIQEIQVPTNVIFMGSTLNEIQNSYPRHLEIIRANSKIKHLFSTYSHYYTKEFNLDTSYQIRYGEKYINKLLNHSDLIPIFTFPEYDFQKGWEKLESLNKYSACLMSSTIIKPHSLEECNLTYKFKSCQTKFLCIHKNINFRTTTHLYLREMCSAKDVIESIKNDAKSLKNNTPLICAIDFEIPVINRVTFKNGEKSPYRLGLFKALFREFKKSDIDFVNLESSIHNKSALKILNYNPKPIKVGVSKSNKYKSVYDFLKLHREHFLNECPQVYFDATTSDFFTFGNESLNFKSKYLGRSGIVEISRSGLNSTRLEHKIDYLKSVLK